MRPTLVAVLLALACACDRAAPAPAAAPPPTPAAAPAPPPPPAQVAAPEPPAPKDWWCACFDRYDASRETHTVCLPTRPACEARELQLAAATANDHLTHGCRLVSAAHPGDRLGARDEWKAGSAPDSWEDAKACRLDGPPTPPINPAAADYALTETLGQFRLGLTADEVALIATPTRKSKSLKNIFDEYEQKWDFPALGVQLTMAAPARKPQILRGIEVKAPGDSATARGIHPGSTRAELEAAYGGLFHLDSSDDHKIVTTGDHGLAFFLKDDKVITIWLGAMAE